MSASTSGWPAQPLGRKLRGHGPGPGRWAGCRPDRIDQRGFAVAPLQWAELPILARNRVPLESRDDTIRLLAEHDLRTSALVASQAQALGHAG